MVVSLPLVVFVSLPLVVVEQQKVALVLVVELHGCRCRRKI